MKFLRPILHFQHFWLLYLHCSSLFADLVLQPINAMLSEKDRDRQREGDGKRKIVLCLCVCVKARESVCVCVCIVECDKL